MIYKLILLQKVVRDNLKTVEEIGDGMLSPSEWIFVLGLTMASFYVFSPQGRIGGMETMKYR